MPGHWEGLSRHKDTSPFSRTLSHCTQVPFMRRISGQNANSREMRFTWEETARNESISRTPLLVLNGIHIGTWAPLGWAWVKAGSGPEPKCHGRDVNGGWRALRMLLNLQLEELWYFKESNLACHLMLLSSGKLMNSVCHGDKTEETYQSLLLTAEWFEAMDVCISVFPHNVRSESFRLNQEVELNCSYCPLALSSK